MRRPTAMVVLAAAMIAGCDNLIPPRPPVAQPAPSNDPQRNAAAATPGGGSAAAGAAIESTAANDPNGTDRQYEGDWRTWYVHRVGSTVVGITEMWAERQLDPSAPIDAPQRLKYVRDERLVFRSGNAQFIRRVRTTSVEDSETGVLSLQAEITAGPVQSQVRAERSRDTLTITNRRPGDKAQTKLAWPAQTRSLFAIEQTLRRSPLENGQTRLLPMMLPSLQSVGMVELKSPGQASVAMLDGSYKLLREVEATFYEDGKPIDSLVLWVDPQGIVEKTLRVASRLETFRTTKSEAERLFGNRDENAVYLFATGKLKSKPDPQQVLFEVAYRDRPSTVSEQQDDASEQTATQQTATQPTAPEVPDVPEIGLQTVQRQGGIARVRVATDGDGQVAANGSDNQPDESFGPVEGDVKPSDVIDSEQAAVARAAKAIDDLPTEELVAELANRVRNQLSLAEQAGLAPASQTLQRRRGGAMDHAVALAAMLRFREIPARVVFGLAPVEESRGDWGMDADNDPRRTRLKLSAWVVAWDDGRWVSIDPMTSQINRADFLTLSVPPAQADLNTAMLDVFRRVAELDVHVEERPGE